MKLRCAHTASHIIIKNNNKNKHTEMDAARIHLQNAKRPTWILSSPDFRIIATPAIHKMLPYHIFVMFHSVLLETLKSVTDRLRNEKPQQWRI